MGVDIPRKDVTWTEEDVYIRLHDKSFIPSLKRDLDAMPYLMHLEVAALMMPRSGNVKIARRLLLATRCALGVFHVLETQMWKNT